MPSYSEFGRKEIDERQVRRHAKILENQPLSLESPKYISGESPEIISGESSEESDTIEIFSGENLKSRYKIFDEVNSEEEEKSKTSPFADV